MGSRVNISIRAHIYIMKQKKRNLGANFKTPHFGVAIAIGIGIEKGR